MQTADRRAAGSLGRRVQQIVQQPLDGREMRQALEALAASSTQGALGRQYDVRAEMQAQTQQLDAEFVAALAAVDAEFGGLEASVQALDAQCQGLRRHVDRARRAAGGVAAQAALLADEQRELGLRQAVAAGLLQQFTLSADEARALERVDGAFFAALDALHAKRRACQALAHVGAQQAAAGDLQRELARLEERAHAALLRWTLAEARALGRGDAPAFSARLGPALRRLESHPALFAAATEEVARARRAALHGAFLDALVRGGRSGTPRPIEAHAADAPRFVGDMLAWVHQAAASERELLDTLLDDAAARAQLLAAALDGVARPLEMRVQQTVAALDAPDAVFRIASLLAFYAEMFAAACPPQAPFVEAVRALAAQAQARLGATLGALADAAVAAVDAHGASPALDVPAPLHALLAAAASVLRQHEDAALHNGDAALQDEDAVVACVRGELARARAEIRGLVAQAGRLRAHEQTMLELNIAAAAQHALGAFPAMQAQCADDELVQRLQLQLLDVLKLKSRLPFDRQGGSAELVECVEQFNRSLKAAMDLDVARLVSRLHNHALARGVCEQTVQLFVAAYAQLHQQIMAADPPPPLRERLLDPDTVATLL
ncbi:Golgi transport complex subunit 6 [Coemansia sp. RSA 2611]|nr:Golgi transport complex subunit 6 [Coemansia sp. RSA 2611]